jgi:precorrin-3B C17-methyltransferase
MDKKPGKIYVVGLGPGDTSMLTDRAAEALKNSDVIVGYKVYTDLIGKLCEGKQVIESGMRQEVERCRMCLDLAKEGRTVALVCSGDAGVYGMASPMLEIAADSGDSDIDIEVVCGITAALSGAATLGAPIGHDFCVISLSDLLTPWELIEKRLCLAAEADLCIVLYNPSSHKRPDYLKRACEIMLTKLPSERLTGYVRNIGREGTFSKICTLKELADEQVDMFTTVFIGNSQTKACDGKLVTPRGYASK